MLKVIGIGDNVVDKYIHTHMMYPGGNALNFSVYAKQLGAQASYLGVFGEDEASLHITKVLKSLEVDISYSRFYPGENGYAMVDLVDGDRVFAGSNKGGVAKENPIKLSAKDLEYMKGFALVHTSCYSNMEEEIVKIKKIGVPVSFDFSNHWDENQLKRVCPNADYSFLSCGHLDDDDAIKRLLESIIGYGGKMALATMGVRGAMLFDGKKVYNQPSNKVDAVDTLGAGDAFVTSFLVNYLRENYTGEMSIKASLLSGASFASKICMVNGAFGYGTKF